MKTTTWRSTIMVAACCLMPAPWLAAETIVKLNLGPTGPDIAFTGGVLATVDDGNGSSPGDQDSSVFFEEFAKLIDGLNDISPPKQGSFSLSGVGAIGIPFVVPAEPPADGTPQSVVQATTGGTFSLYDDSGDVLLTGELEAGSIYGHSGASGTSTFLTANLGTFTGPEDTELFDVVKPNSASLVIALSGVQSGSNGAPGLVVANNVLQDFIADSQVTIGADPSGRLVPEPGALGLLALALLAVSSVRRRR